MSLAERPNEVGEYVEYSLTFGGMVPLVWAMRVRAVLLCMKRRERLRLRRLWCGLTDVTLRNRRPGKKEWRGWENRRVAA